MSKEALDNVVELEGYEAINDEPEKDEPVDLVIKFKKPYEWEGKTYTEIDLSALERLTGEDMVEINNLLGSRGRLPVLQEMSLEYAQEMAAHVTGMPIEFFKGLPAKKSMKLKNIVSNFIHGEE